MMLEADGLSALVADLTAAPLKVQVASAAIVKKGAQNIKDEAVRTASGMAHAPLYPRSISYDVSVSGRGNVEAEIGPDKDRPQGALGNLLEYGSVNNPPHAHMGPALDREGPGFEKAIETAAGEAL